MLLLKCVLDGVVEVFWVYQVLWRRCDMKWIVTSYLTRPGVCMMKA